MNIHACNKLEQENLVGLNRILLAYAHSKLSFLSWNHKHEGATKGRKANDFVQEALKEFLTNENRKWDPTNNPDIVKYLKGTISSLISNAITSKENKLGSAITPSELEDEYGFPIISYFPDVESQLVADDIHQKLKFEINLVDDETGILGLVFDLKVNDHMKTREICEALDLEPSFINNALKRIRRVCKKVYQNL